MYYKNVPEKGYLRENWGELFTTAAMRQQVRYIPDSILTTLPSLRN